METTQKLVFAGDTVSLYHFEKPITYGEKTVNNKKKIVEEFSESVKSTKEENRARTMREARNKMILYINANFDKWKDEKGKPFNSVFLTLTFKENITDITEANYEFKKFIQRLNNHITGYKKSYLKYVNAIEFQKRGAVHYHCVLFNMPFIPKGIIEDIWGHGYIFINKINNASGVGKYISKYITKSFEDKRLWGKKCYSISLGLKKPTIIRNIRDINFFLQMLPLDNVSRRVSYTSQYLGEVDVFEYDIKNSNYSYEDFQAIFAMKYGSSVE